MPLCASEGIGVVPYQVLQGGLLTGKYAASSPPPSDSRAAEKPEWIPLLQDEAVRRQVAALQAAGGHAACNVTEASVHEAILKATGCSGSSTLTMVSSWARSRSAPMWRPVWP